MSIPAGALVAARFRSLRRVRRVLTHACAVLTALSTVATTATAQRTPAAGVGTDGPAVVERARALLRHAATVQAETPTEAIAHGTEALRLLGASRELDAHVSMRTLAHNVLASAYTTLGRYDSAATAAHLGRRLAERSGDRAGLAHAFTSLGALAQRRGDPARAVAHLDRALAIQRALGADSAVAASLNLLGFVHATDFADYDRGLAYQLESLRVRERLGGDPTGLATTLNSLGVVYQRLRQHDRALALFTRALSLYRDAGAEGRAAATLSNLGDLRLAGGDAAGALADHRASLALRRRVGDRWSLSLAHRNVGLTYLALGRTADAHVALAEAMRLGAGTGNRGLAARNLLALSAVERARGRPPAAERAADSALTLAGAMGSRELARRGWQALAQAQEAGGRLAAALASQRRFEAVSDSIFDERTSRRVASLEERVATERREREIERLRSAQALSALQAGQRATQRNAIALLALLLLTVGGAAYRRRARDARRAEAASLTDSLTGVRNRRYVRETIARELAAVRPPRAGRPERRAPGESALAFLLLDLDHFKQVNDGFGHGAGDRLLADLARLLESTCGASDEVVRWGGEEFLVVSRGTDHAGARQLAERIRAAVASHVTTLEDGRTLRVTCSIGFAIAPRAAGASAWGWEAVVALADHGTYAAKRLGRNAWVGYSAGQSELPPSSTTSPAVIEAWVADGRLRQEHSVGLPPLAA
jgi:diguanylate cyclase (GGDEF)-like protein